MISSFLSFLVFMPLCNPLPLSMASACDLLLTDTVCQIRCHFSDHVMENYNVHLVGVFSAAGLGETVMLASLLGKELRETSR